MGRQGAELLFERLAGLEGPPIHKVIPGRLIERGTGELTPADEIAGAAT